MGTMAKFSKHESLSAVKKDKQIGNKAMFGTNKLCLKGIYLPTFQRSIILRANKGYKKITQLFTQFDNLWRKKLVSLLVFLYIYMQANIQILYRFFCIISLDKTSRYSDVCQGYQFCLFLPFQCLSHVRRVSGHVYVCQEYQFFCLYHLTIGC